MKNLRDPLQPVRLSKPENTPPAPERVPVRPLPSEPRDLRSSTRRPCSFPGVLRVLMPEQTFTPRALSVRVIDLSPTGARVETVQLTHDKYFQMIAEPRFVRLDVILPNKLTVAGRLVWVDYSNKLSTLGIAISPRREDLARECLPDYSSSLRGELAPPVIEHYPSTTGRNPFTFFGSAPGAEAVLIEFAERKLEIPVKNGKFYVSVTLAENSPNHLQFYARSGKKLSTPTPAWIAHQIGQHDTQTFMPEARLLKDIVVSEEGRKLSLHLKGSPGEVATAMQRVGDVLGFADEVALQVHLYGDGEKAARCLKRGGRNPARS